ncbi:MAG: hypothetical protein KJ674_00435 [Nanoarchaeota archaeon]|nr:hypothetical protein [Nanoarchaeota archaeon]
MKKKVNKNICCGCDGRFPTFAVILIFLGLIWLLNDLKVFSIDLPWIPIIVIVFAIGLIVNHSKKK